MRIRLAGVVAVTVAMTAGILAGPVLAADTPAARTAPGSPLAKVVFPVAPFPLADDGTYAAFMADVAKSLNRTCGRLESYGWEFPGQEGGAPSERVATVIKATMGNFEKVGYRLDKAQTVTLPDPDMSVYTAVKEPATLLLLWAPLPDSAMLLLCDASASN